jgi:hypothetical protein
MDAENTFRQTLIGELAELANSRELDKDLVQMRHVEDKRDILGEWLDYYTQDLLAFRPFTAEFALTEIEAPREFLTFVDSAFEGRATWSDLRTRSANLLALLQAEPPPCPFPET